MKKLAFVLGTAAVLFAALTASPAAYAAPAAADADEARVDQVLAKMSKRFKDEVHITDRKAFLADLRAVLSEEQASRNGDLSLLLLVDKTHSLKDSYVPAGMVTLKSDELFNVNKTGMTLRPDAYRSLQEMCRGALADGIKLLVSSAYRSYAYQENLFNYWVRVDGLEEAERESARPGTSQHQLGTAIDFGSISDDFDTTPMGRWVYAHAAEYGWSLSFPKQYEDVTGYRWECWHFRYIGKAACALQKKWFANVQQYMLEFINEWNA